MIGDLRCGVAEVDRVPDREFLRRTRLDRTGHFGRQAETRDINLADETLVFDDLGSGQNADRRRSNDDLDVRVRLQEAFGFAVRLVGEVVAINGGDEVQTVEVLQLLLHLVNPDVLVRRGGGCRQDREVTLAAFEVILDERQAHLADQFVRRRVQLQDTAVLVDTGIPGDDLDATLLGLL